MFRLTPRLSQRATIALAIASVTATAAGAATIHRLTVTNTTGSGGATDFLQTTTTGSALQGDVGASPDTGYTIAAFGVFGDYNSTAKFGIGVLGASTNGYGVAGESLSSSPSLLGYPGSTGDGTDTTTTGSGSAYALFAEGKGANTSIYSSALGSGYAGFFESETGTALYATGPGTTGVAVLAQPDGTGVEAHGYSAGAPALVVDSSSAAETLIAATPQSTSAPQFLVQGTTMNRSGEVGSIGSDVEVKGDLYVYGSIYDDCGNIPVTSSTGCYSLTRGGYGTTGAAVTRSSGGNDVQVYPARQTLPTVEDFGQAQMVGGRAFVRLDPAFAATMSRAQPYLVFITPEGQSHGVYATNRTPQGFEVRENDGGRSTTAFDYRIVARPLGDTSARLASVNAKKFDTSRPISAADGIAAGMAEKARLMATHPRHAIQAPMTFASSRVR